jgi:hypothetical protein
MASPGLRYRAPHEGRRCQCRGVERCMQCGAAVRATAGVPPKTPGGEGGCAAHVPQYVSMTLGNVLLKNPLWKYVESEILGRKKYILPLKET